MHVHLTPTLLPHLYAPPRRASSAEPTAILPVAARPGGDARPGPREQSPERPKARQAEKAEGADDAQRDPAATLAATLAALAVAHLATDVPSDRQADKDRAAQPLG